MENIPQFKTAIWQDIAEEDNPFEAKQSLCHGYDVYADLLGKASYSQYILTLFLGEKPNSKQLFLFDCLAVALANAGPRDLAIRSAMNSGVGGAPAAANLMSFLAVAAGNYQGSHELAQLVCWFERFKLEFSLWASALEAPNSERTREDIWEKFEHPPGFLPHATSASGNTINFLELGGRNHEYESLSWLKQHRADFEKATGMAMGLNFIAAACFYELGFSSDKAELASLILRLPGAAVHSLEAKQQGWKQFPFFGKQTELTEDPGKLGSLPDVSELLK